MVEAPFLAYAGGAARVSFLSANHAFIRTLQEIVLKM